MHCTSTTHITDAFDRLVKLDGRLRHASFIPAEQLLGTLVAGSILLNELLDATKSIDFTDEEETFINCLSDSINAELLGIMEKTEPEIE